jgi:hypothetical protein
VPFKTVTDQPVGHWTVAEYDAAVDAGIFGIGDAKIELVRGEIYPTRMIGANGLASMGTPHANAIQRLMRSAIRYFDDSYRVGCQTPVIIGDHSEPEPDLWIATGDSAVKPFVRHPDGGVSLLLVVEVSDSTLRSDLTVKVPMYLEGGVPAVWVVDLAGGCVKTFYDGIEGTIFGGLVIHEPTGWSIDTNDLFD